MKKAFIVLAVGFFVFGCTSKDQLKKTLEENPDIVFDVIKKNPAKFFETVRDAQQNAQESESKNREEQEKQALEKDFAEPITPEIQDGRMIFGNKEAPITIVEYSDFQCPFCARGHQTMAQIKQAYPDKVRFVYKHLPFKRYAEISARYYEAVALQGRDKAEKFLTIMFENQRDLEGGEPAIEKLVKQAGANLAQAKKELNSERITKLIEADRQEAEKFGFNGTPGFSVNGVRVYGAFPVDHFKMIIDRHLSKM